MRGLRALFVNDTHVLSRTTDEDISGAGGSGSPPPRPSCCCWAATMPTDAEDALRLFEALGAIRARWAATA